MRSLVSVIVPVYNVSRYLDECIQSILRQTYENMEIILVDDGSTDGSGSICDGYAASDKRVKVIHKKNGGLSDARNAGLGCCKGEYIAFVDSDDYVSEYFLEIMVNAAKGNGCEIAALEGGCDFWDTEGIRPGLAKQSLDFSMEILDARNALERMLYQIIATGAPFKIYKRDIFDNIKFPLGYYYEDVATTYKLFGKAHRIVIVDSPLYAYRKRDDSIIRQKFNEKKLSCLKIYEEITTDSIILEWNLERAAQSRAFAMVYSVFLQIPPEDSKTRKMVWDKIVECRKSVALNRSKLMRKKNRYAAFVAYLGADKAFWIGKRFGQKGSFQK